MNSKSNCHHRGKLLFTSLAAATLGLIIMSPDTAKADTLVDSAAAKKQVAQSSSLPASNVAQPSTSPSSEAQDANEPPAAGEEAKGITPRSVLTASWKGLKVTLDTATGIATIPGGTISNPNYFYQLFRDNDVYKSIKKIKITGPLKLVGNATWMFDYLSSLTEIEGLDQVDTSEVTNMYGMFSSCESLEHLDLSNFNTKKVTNMAHMFSSCYKLSSIDLHSFDTSSVTDMSFMFVLCTSLTSLDLRNFNTAKVTNMWDMFGSTNSLTSLDLSNFDTAKVTDMRNMFFGCQNLKTLNISSFQMAQVTSKSEMLKSIPKLSTLVLGPKNYLRGTDLDATGVWLNVGNGTIDNPQGNKRWTSSQLMSNYSGSRDQDTYVRLGGAVTVHYLDEAGKKLVEDKILNGKIGDSYSSEPQDIAGYVLKTTPANAKGTYTDKVQEVTYVYTNQVKVLVHYVDQDGKPIADDDTLTGKIGDDYPAKEIAGYVIQTKPSGKFSASVTEVTYVYTNQVKVLAHYVDQDGKPIADDETLRGKIGDDYPAKEIAGYVIQTKPTGKFSGTETEVTYVYTNQVKALAHYVDQDGKPIAADETLTGKIGDDYPAKEIAGYVIQTKPSGKFSPTVTEVTYVYTNQVKVLAHYVDQDGKPIADEDTLTGKIGDDYPDKTIAGYVIQTKPSGKFSATVTEVTYVYTNQVKVLAHYVDQDGKPIADDETISGKIGDDYPAKEIAGYVIQTKPSGKFSASVTEVTYVYTNQVKVLAHYVDQDGKPIADDETISGKIGDDYPAKEIAGYVIQTKPTGKFSASVTEVTYVYTNQVKVLAHYVDQDGKPIADDETISGKIGDDYPAKEIAGYVIQTKPTGKFSASVTEVTYVYTNQVKVLAHYVDQDGKPIADDDTLNGKIGDDYPAKEIAGYVIQTKPSGKFSATVTEVTYVYTNQVKVLAHYVDQDGKPIADDDTLTGKIGDDYPAKEIAGYVIQTKPSGKFSATVTEVTYVYTNQVKVLAHYVDQDGKPIADDETISGKIGDDYPAKEIAGYVIQTKPSGKFSATVTEVTYVYTNQVKVLAHYVDQDGKPIAGVTDETLTGTIGDPYPDSAVKDIKGYTLKTKPTGKFSGTETEVTYIYAKLVTVVAHYVDQDGKPIAGITDEHLTGAIGDPYPDSAVKDIKGYTLKTKPTGKFSGTETEVTYVYTKNASVNPGGTAGRQPIVGGSVTVHYQDETGKQLAPDQILTGNVGEGYLTQEVALAGYKLTQRPANATGFYTANPQSVTYIYTKNVTGQAAVRRTVFHNSYLYDQNGGRKTGKYLMGKTIWTYGTKVIQGKKYYDLGQDSYVKATNVSGVKRKLRRNSYVYGKTAKKLRRLQRKALKRGQKVRTYGAAVKIHRKLYYIVGKNQYVKKSNF
ncbi:MucBP domain-containing protein [Lactobacillus melliventris]|uniref:BspA family leucine-rich repeat surface protein n=1 Tax=Lactobacillus melliventris TaxID=1218507 RepID=A0ABX5N4X0_9LACO|nr:MucBP domain-containing protein [Lactobacillus melliventris]PXY85111.1 hypothetical protein DK873_08235 [Lactobacillus melliventris]